MQVLLNLTEFGIDPAESVSASRFSTDHCVGSFNQPEPKLGSLGINQEVGAAVIEELEARGHQVKKLSNSIAQPIVIRIDPQTGALEAAGDPRAGRHAAAF